MLILAVIQGLACDKLQAKVYNLPGVCHKENMSSPSKSASELQLLFEQQGGYLTASEARAQGIQSEQLARFVSQGAAERVQRGVYRLLDETIAFGAAEELLELQLRVPAARPCLVSALHLHGLTTTRPATLQMAVPANRSFPAVASSKVEVFYFRPRRYSYGLFELPVASRLLTTYTPEKTLADLLHFSAKYGRDLYLEGLKNYLRIQGNRGTRALLDAGRAVGVFPALRRDLEVLSHDQDH